MDANYQDLANAIVLRAAKDYRRAMKRLSQDPNSSVVECEIRQLEDFFYSDYYKLLTKLDPEKLMEALRQEVQDDSEAILEQSL